jgi:hypothetical protein
MRADAALSAVLRTAPAEVATKPRSRNRGREARGADFQRIENDAYGGLAVTSAAAHREDLARDRPLRTREADLWRNVIGGEFGD